MSRQKILIVDDKDENLYTLEQILKETDADIISARNGNDALIASLNHEFALAILDVQMPEMDGYELADFLRSDTRTKNLPVIFLSAVYSDEYHVFKGYESGAVDFITKPYNPKIFLSKVNHFLSRNKLLHELQKEIADRKRIEVDLQTRTKELEAANKELESFSYSVSHDLRAPLRAIDGYSRMLVKEMKNKPTAESERKLKIIRENIGKMEQLIDDLLAFSRLGRQAMTINPIDIGSLVDELWSGIYAINPGRSMELRKDKLPQAHGDAHLVKQVLFNLMANAVKFTKIREHAIIEIGGNDEGSNVLIYIKDNGAGFNMDYYNKLFNVFQRLHSSEEFEGTGIGLATVQRIINKHNGRIWAEGKVDQGATFYFSLPKLSV
ncbi:MAG: ATP-binding protein [Smithella sp.]